MTTAAGTTLAERLVDRIARRTPRGSSRRGFLAGAAVVGAAVAVNPWGYLVRSANAYDSVCGSQPNCSDGYSAFCCTINEGVNSCPPNSFIGGWWKADRSSFCGGSARYYIDCNAYRNGAWKCHCASGTCDSRRVACNQFRYGQCNLSIPYENTGPVVCRIISCTPPWQQFGGVCTSSSSTDNSTATHNAPCVGVPPRGALESAVPAGTAIRVRGWAFDPDQPATAVSVTVTRNGTNVRTVPTSVARPDINKAYGITGAHGYDITVPAVPGRSNVAVTALNIAGGRTNGLLGSRSVVVATPTSLPVGRLEHVTSVPGGHLRLRGWAFDRDRPATSIQVAVYLDGVFAHWFPTAVDRPDVNKAYRLTGRHGFDITIPAKLGAHRVSVYGINVGGGHGNPLFGSARGAALASAPAGHLDKVAPGHRIVTLSGWAFDPDATAKSLYVAVYRDDVFLHWFRTTVARPDVNAVHSITGIHGFSIPVASAPGRHEFSVFAINDGPGGGNPLIGSSTVVVPA